MTKFALEHKRKFGRWYLMSALPLKAEVLAQQNKVCFVPGADIVSKSFAQPVATLSETIESGPQFVTPHRHLAACYAQLDKMVLACDEAMKILELDARFGVDTLIPRLPFKRDEDLQHYLNALVKAGLPH